MQRAPQQSGDLRVQVGTQSLADAADQSNLISAKGGRPPSERADRLRGRADNGERPWR
jgi:hypothetical protein